MERFSTSSKETGLNRRNTIDLGVNLQEKRVKSLPHLLPQKK